MIDKDGFTESELEVTILKCYIPPLQGLENPFQAARYHSLVIDQDGFPESELEVTARTEDGTIMAVRHRRLPHIQVLCVCNPGPKLKSEIHSPH